ncbi:MAG: hypothetical protein RSG53_01320 [Oscillospiraceae bacterium]
MGNILCIIDGMTDEDFRFEQYPNLNRAKNRFAYGTLDTVPDGARAESLPCILSILGVEDGDIGMFSRGWVEALGAEIPFLSNDMLVRTTCVSVGRDGRIGGVREMPPTDEPGLYQIGSYQGLLVLKGMADETDKTRTFAPYSNPNAEIKDLIPLGCEALAEFAKRNFKREYALVPWGQAASGEVMARHENSVMVASAPIAKGIARALGMRCITPRGATGDTDTDLVAKLECSLESAQEKDFVCLHINGADEASHRADKRAKREFLNRIDSLLVQRLCESKNRVLICSDHGTSPENGAHIGAPQPFILISDEKRGNLNSVKATGAINILKGLI